MRLIACRSCHTQFDADQVATARFACRCGATVEKLAIEPHDAPVVRCGSCGGSLAPEGGSCSFCGSVVARLADVSGPVCPECFARTPAGSRFCTACGVAFQPERLVVQARELPCPACSLPMGSRAVAGIGVDECASCHGLWIPEGRLEDLVEQARAVREDEAGAQPAPRAPRVRSGNPAVQRVEYRRCPECDAQMQRRNFRRSSGIIVDVCRRHGTWLDADELERIAGFVQGRGRDADFVAARRREPDPEARRDAADAADSAFARILAEHRVRERSGSERSATLLEILFGLVR